MVPNDWIHTTFEKHIDLLNGFAFKSVNYSSEECDIRLLRGDNIEPGSLRWRGVKRWPANELEKLNKFQLAEHDFVIAMDRTWITSGLKVAEVKPSDLPCLLVQRVSRIRALPTLNQSLLRQYFSGHRFEQYVKSVQTETAVPHISPSQIKEFSFLLPPLPEQRKIAKILGTWDKAISTTERLIDNSKQQKKALMQQLLTGAHKGKRLLDDSGKPFEGDWERVMFDDCIKHTGGTALEKHVIDDAKHHFISIGNYAMDGKYIDKGQRIALNNKTITKLLNKNDLVMVLNDKTKTGDIIGATILIDEDDKYIYNQRSERITPNEGINTLFFWFLLNSSHFRAEVFSRSQGGTQIYVNFGTLKTIYLNLPSNKEQQKIASVLTNADKETELLEQQLDDLKQEKKALMQQLLTGKRRVLV